MMWVIPCDNCGGDNRALHISYPNPTPEYCPECRQQRNIKTIEESFCSWKCLIEWATKYQSSEQKVKRDESE